MIKKGTNKIVHVSLKIEQNSIMLLHKNKKLRSSQVSSKSLEQVPFKAFLPSTAAFRFVTVMNTEATFTTNKM